jgi:hypothetical protein
MLWLTASFGRGGRAELLDCPHQNDGYLTWSVFVGGDPARRPHPFISSPSLAPFRTKGDFLKLLALS